MAKGLACCILLAAAAVLTATYIPSRAETGLFLARKRVELLRKRIEKDCPQVLRTEPWLGKRHTVENTLPHEVSSDIEAELYNKMLQLYIKCQVKTTSSSKTISTTPTSTTTTYLPTTTTMTPTSTATTTTTTPSTTEPEITNSKLPQCVSTSTVNLTQYWRNNYSGSRLSNSDVDSLYKVWFRFTGAAGNQLKNTCPTQYSCGSTGAYWSDDHMPTVVGDTRSFTMYESVEGCKKRRFAATVTKCSSLHSDYVYRLDVKMSGGYDTFCGMN